MKPRNKAQGFVHPRGHDRRTAISRRTGAARAAIPIPGLSREDDVLHRGFTLIELLVATVLAALLLGGVVMIAGAAGRDAKRLRSSVPANDAEPIAALLRWDFTNASQIQQSPAGSGFVLIGQGGLDRNTLTPTNRLTRVAYLQQPGGAWMREQRYLDDPIRPQPWRELITARPASIQVLVGAIGGDTSGSPGTGRDSLPPRVQIRVAIEGSGTVEETLCLH